MSPDKKKIKHVFISACEPSADAHCARLIEAVKLLDDSVEFVGVGGDKMAAAGCTIIENTVDKAAMMYNALGQVSFYIKLLKRIKTLLRDSDIDKVVVCDSPAFNFHVAKAATKMAVPTLFYVAPQLWAWAPWRIHKLKKCCSQLASILPFEKQWFQKRGLSVEFVGNPLFDELVAPVRDNIKDYSDYNPDSARVLLLAGSRNAEIETLWQPMQQIAMEIKKTLPEAKFVAVASNSEKLSKLKSLQLNDLEIEYSSDSVIDTCKRVDYCFVASGSATLQVAASGCPMVVMYHANKWVWHLLGRWLINTKHLSLVNIVAQKELVPEFMPYFTSIEPICDVAISELRDKKKLSRISRELVEMVEPMTALDTSEQVAKMLLDLI